MTRHGARLRGAPDGPCLYVRLQFNMLRLTEDWNDAHPWAQRPWSTFDLTLTAHSLNPIHIHITYTALHG